MYRSDFRLVRILFSTVILFFPVLLQNDCKGSGNSHNTVNAVGDTDTDIDTTIDADGDGWRIMDNDCSDDPVANPRAALINPGAFEITGNGFDDDCDETTSDTEPPAACSDSTKFGSVTSRDLVQALELCRSTNETESIENRKWGLISAELLNADGSLPDTGQLSDISDSQTAILSNYGTGGIVPKSGTTMTGLSSGMMRDKDDPGYVAPNTGTNFGRTSSLPSGFTNTSSSGCSTGSSVYDSVNLRLRIRVPTNAWGFSFKFRFFSSDYWSNTCNSYNDLFLALLTSGAEGIPSDRNIIFDAQGDPVSVNWGFITVCTPNGGYSCENGPGELTGTGMEEGHTGGGTPWLQTMAPVVPGEIMTLEFVLLDLGDGIMDAIVLIDDFRWLETMGGQMATLPVD